VARDHGKVAGNQAEVPRDHGKVARDLTIIPIGGAVAPC
jgi:hypothetical protein